MALTKIVSGGRTGVDRAALDAALAVGFPCGGRGVVSRAADPEGTRAAPKSKPGHESERRRRKAIPEA
jgi:Circularly permutated YpsA SLOG family